MGGHEGDKRQVRTVYKHALQLVSGPQQVSTFEGARVRLVAMQDHTLCVWIEADTDAPKQDRYFEISGTGRALDVDAEWVGSCQSSLFVWHVYEMRG